MGPKESKKIETKMQQTKQKLMEPKRIKGGEGNSLKRELIGFNNNKDMILRECKHLVEGEE